MFTKLIGINRIKGHEWYTLFFRDTARGHKYSVIVYEASGIKDLYMCATIPHITDEEFKALPDIELSGVTREICNNSI